MLDTLSDWLKGLGGAGGKSEGPSGAGLAYLLGSAGAAVSPEESWQQRLGATAAKMGREKQSRKYLSELLGMSAEKDAEAESEEGGDKDKEEKSALSTGQLDALRNPGLGDILSDYFSKTLPKTGR